MLEQIRRALKPGGRLVIADYSDRPARSQPREDQTKKHFLSPGLVSEELKHAGFEIVKLDDPLLERKPAMKNARIEGAIAELSAALEREKELKKTDNLSGETSNVFQYSIDMDKVILAKDKEIESLRERLEKAETRIKQTGSGINKMWS